MKQRVGDEQMGELVVNVWCGWRMVRKQKQTQHDRQEKQGQHARFRALREKREPILKARVADKKTCDQKRKYCEFEEICGRESERVLDWLHASFVSAVVA